jgi:hypothetical protein
MSCYETSLNSIDLATVDQPQEVTGKLRILTRDSAMSSSRRITDAKNRHNYSSKISGEINSLHSRRGKSFVLVPQG